MGPHGPSGLWEASLLLLDLRGRTPVRTLDSMLLFSVLHGHSDGPRSPVEVLGD